MTSLTPLLLGHVPLLVEANPTDVEDEDDPGRGPKQSRCDGAPPVPGILSHRTGLTLLLLHSGLSASPPATGRQPFQRPVVTHKPQASDHEGVAGVSTTPWITRQPPSAAAQPQVRIPSVTQSKHHNISEQLCTLHLSHMSHGPSLSSCAGQLGQCKVDTPEAIRWRWKWVRQVVPAERVIH